MRNRRSAILLPLLFVLLAGAIACASSSTDSTSDTPTSTTTAASNASLLTTHPAFGTCPDSAFPDLSGTSAGANYAAPNVTVTCTDTEVTVTSNNMISYEFVSKTPNALAPQNFTWKIPLKPTKAAAPTNIENRLGTLGFTVTGIAIYGPTEGPMPADEAYGDPVGNGLMDYCGGHTGPSADYHYHTIIYTDAVCNFETSQLVGFAIDGFPIYNSVICLNAGCTQTTLAKSGYTKTGDSKSYVWKAYTFSGGTDPGTLDACNGRIEADGTYAYHLTPTQFPYILGCLTGTATTQTGSAAAQMPPMQGQQLQGQQGPPGPQGPPRN
jgi:hypothetical protein